MGVINDFYTLDNGVKIPKLGFGTAPLNGEEAYQAVREALDSGYRHIDTAQIYDNEEEVGRAIKDSQLNRKDIFLTSKLDPAIKTHDAAIEAFDQSLKRLQTDYLDLYLIHAPWPWSEIGSDQRSGNIEVFKAFEKLYEEGRVKAIGISNFGVDDIDNLINHCKITPHVNQIKCHIGHAQEAIIIHCNKHNILVEAYSPLGRGNIVSHPTIRTLADKYDVTAAQLALRYLLEQNLLPIPRSKNPDHIRSNTKVDFKIDNEDLSTLFKLELN